MGQIWGRARPFIEHHFGLFLVGAFVIGLFVPWVENTPKTAMPCILALIIFISCAKIKVADFKEFRARDVAGIVVVRFLFFPFIMYELGSAFVPEYRYALLMLGLLPCGATLTAVMGIVGGSAALGLSATTLTSMLTPFSIPLAFSLVSDMGVEVDLWGMFRTLAFMIFLPVGLYFGVFRKFEKPKLVMRENASALSCLLICCGIIIVVSYQQDMFFNDPALVAKTMIIGVIAYAVFYILGWFFFRRGDFTKKLSYALMSGNNNINLGISLAVLFMPAFESAVMIIWELNWILGLTAFQIFLRWRRRKNQAA